MALTSCPECRREVSDRAATCPGCGHPLAPPANWQLPAGFPFIYGYEYKSKTTIFGLPLVHIAQGFSPEGRYRVAKGFIAIGNVAVGVLAIGGAAIGVVALSGVGLGIVCLGGVAIGVFCGIGGVAIGYIAVGGIAIGIYCLGGLCLGPHTIFNDPDMLRRLESLFRP
jgi:hypothetical protein